jgi:flagellar biogenesis protein FliO
VALVDLGRVVLSFGFVILLMLGIAWLARRFELDKRFQGQKSDGSLKVTDSLFLDPKRRVVKMTDGSKDYLLLLGMHNEIMLDAAPTSSVSNSKQDQSHDV